MKTSKYFLNRTGRGSSERGAALAVVMILCLATLILVGSFLRSTSTQAQTNNRAILLSEARNAAEGVAEYALAEMNRRASANPSFGAAADPLLGFTLPAADLTYLAPGTGMNHVVSTQVGFKAGDFIAAGVMQTLDVDDPVNISDGEKGKLLNIRELQIYGKAAVRDPLTRGLITSYVSETVQVREQAWFNYAIFFNMDMEFHSATTMDIFGPVFTNATAYVASGSSQDLNFYSNFSAVQKIIRGVKYNGGTTSHPGDVSFIKAGGMNVLDLVLMGTTQDSNTTAAGGFRTLGRTRWNDFVQDQSYSVAKFNPPGLPAYIPEDFSTGAVELRNNAWIMIESQLSNLVADADYGQKSLATENLKLSALSGFVIQVDAPLTIGAQPKWRILVYQGTDTTHPISQNNPPARSGVNGKPVVVATIDPFVDQDGGPANDGVGALPVNGAAAGTWKMKRSLKTALLDAIVSVPYGDAGTVNGTNWGNGFSNLRVFNQVAPATTATNYYPAYDRREGYIYPNGATSTTNLLKGAMNVIRIDMGKLNALINNATGIWLNPDPARATQLVYDVANAYTGVVYVQFPLAAKDATRFPAAGGGTGPNDSDQLRPAQAPTTTTPGYAVVLANAGTLPQRAGGIPDGFSIATNGPVYVAGHYNADGNSATGSATAPDSASEVPAMIAADTVTILSPGFNFQQMATTKNNSAGFTEVSAAIVTGLVPTRPGTGDIWAGGVHNFARFHEDWSGDTYRYRGSLAALFECEVNKAPWRQTYYTFWYTPPTRDVGYHQYLAGGRFPPGTPVKRTVRRINLQDITAATYTTGP